ncbi:16075_t:CDS:2 [Entrophospora sp. SA101]|nr:16075_t:CDS:2 [Entrophospora sp. SA101]
MQELVISEKESQNKNLTEENKGLQNQLHLTEKDLPDLPKKQSKFRRLRTKLKTEFHQLVENKKTPNPRVSC